MMKKANLAKWVGLWLLMTTLIMPLMGMAESPKITVDPVVHDGRFVIFVLKNYEDKGFVCTFIQARATIKNHQGKGEVITRRSIVAESVILPAGSREKQVEVDKEFIKELESQFDQPRIVDVTVPTYSCLDICSDEIIKEVDEEIREANKHIKNLDEHIKNLDETLIDAIDLIEKLETMRKDVGGLKTEFEEMKKQAEEEKKKLEETKKQLEETKKQLEEEKKKREKQKKKCEKTKKQLEKTS
ncbi:hypothetical protein [Candidatus Parabeggiatoa sp. HSG14]|uniref:hypothetical protein n=1 Tax=Candidatus Parabeggiatoa sp. HSG14 TaxID=3055593 RepID=UPI0025A6ED9E|nr:hypothetical protein [Thiotrichales bacterium HSG14]